MDNDLPLSDAPVVGATPPPAADVGSGAPRAVAKPGPKNKGGRGTAAQEVDAYLAKHGLVAIPTTGAPPASAPAPGPESPPVAASEPFDEAATRAGIEGLVKSASGIAEWTVANKAAEITEDEKKAAEFGAAAAMPDPTQRLVIESGVAWARKTGTNVGPELGVIAGLGQWAMQLRGIVADLREIAAVKRGAGSGEPGAKPHGPPT